jgi:hypothetical protein
MPFRIRTSRTWADRRSWARRCGLRPDNALDAGARDDRVGGWRAVDLESRGRQVLYQSPSGGLVSCQTASHAGREFVAWGRHRGGPTLVARTRNPAVTRPRRTTGARLARTRPKPAGLRRRSAAGSGVLPRELSPHAVSRNVSSSGALFGIEMWRLYA